MCVGHKQETMPMMRNSGRMIYFKARSHRASAVSLGMTLGISLEPIHFFEASNVTAAAAAADILCV